MHYENLKLTPRFVSLIEKLKSYFMNKLVVAANVIDVVMVQYVLLTCSEIETKIPKNVSAE